MAKTELNYYPVRAVKKLLEASHITTRALFRGITKDNTLKSNALSSEVIYKVIKNCALILGYDFHDYCPHSLRSGFTTHALGNNARLDKITSIILHKNLRSLDSYIKHED